MKKRYIAVALVGLGLSALAFRLVSPMVQYGYGFNEALARCLLSRPGETMWAPGYDEARFMSITNGMSREDVYRLLGEPVKRWHTRYQDCLWDYSWQTRGDDSFDARKVLFKEDGTVEYTVKEYYVD